jgi:HK97 family phage prohead protease
MMIHKSCQFEIKADTETRIIKGWASVYNVLDLGRDKMISGVFKDTLKTRKGKIPILWQHRSDSPIGLPNILDERKQNGVEGLYFESHPLPDLADADKVLTLIREKLVTGVSVGIRVEKQMWVEGDNEKNERGHREIHKAKLYEFSVVTFPMNESARLLNSMDVHSIQDLADKIRKGLLNESDLKELTGAIAYATKSDYSEITEKISQWRRTLEQ